MPDIHQGYGFPVGGVAATEPPDGVISPGGVGYDINCGVRLLALPLSASELGGRAKPLVHEISRRVPVGAGHGGALRLAGAELDRVLVAGPARAVGGAGHRHSRGHRAHRVQRVPGRSRSVRRCPNVPETAAPTSSARSARATTSSSCSASRRSSTRRRPGLRAARGPADRADPLRVARARPPGLHRLRAPHGRRAGAATGSRCPTASSPARRCPRPRAELPRRDGAAANFAWANRAVLAHRVREAVSRGARRTRRARHARSTTSRTTSPSSRSTTAGPLCVHRKGATRAFAARLRRDPGRLPGGRPARVHPREHGDDRASSWPVSPGRWSSRSAAPATAPDGG